MCDDKVGVAKRVDLEAVSKDIAALVKNLEQEVEGDIQVQDIKNIQQKLKNLIS